MALYAVLQLSVDNNFVPLESFYKNHFKPRVRD